MASARQGSGRRGIEMTPEMFSERLRASAVALDWEASVVDAFTAQQFRGRAEVTEKSLPKDAIGLRLGDYPVLVASIELGDVADMQASLRSLRTQMVIARSYMVAEEVINAHIMLIALDPDPLKDWRRAFDLAERDETVCRRRRRSGWPELRALRGPAGVPRHIVRSGKHTAAASECISSPVASAYL